MRYWLVLGLLALCGCHQRMMNQAKYQPYEAADLFPDGKEAQAPVPGTVARGDLAWEAKLATRPPMNAALLARGRERFEIYCAVCHGYTGEGDGRIVQRGMPHPPSYLEDRLRAAPDSHFLTVIANGYGAMYSYADRVAPEDRWAIVAYIRALQLAGHAEAAKLAPSDREALR